MKIQIIDRTITFVNKEPVEGQPTGCDEVNTDVVMADFEGSTDIATGIMESMDKRGVDIKFTDEGVVISNNYNWASGSEKVLIIKIFK